MPNVRRATRLLPGLLLGLALALPARLHAQIVPGVEDFEWDRQRREYNANVMKEYQALMNEWRSAWVARDARRLAAAYTPAATLVFEDGTPVQGSRAIQAALQARLEGRGELRTGLTDFMASERLAYAIGPYFYEIQGPDGATREVTGTYVAVLIRERDTWRFRTQTFTPIPPEILEPDSAAGPQ